MLIHFLRDLGKARCKLPWVVLVKPPNKHEGAFENYSTLGPGGDFHKQEPILSVQAEAWLGRVHRAACMYVLFIFFK